MAILSLMSFLIIMPFITAIPAAGFLLVFRFRRQKLALTAGVLWALYGLYETGMYLRLLCSGECNIRVDLLLIYPLLLAVSLLSLIALAWDRRRRAP